MFVVVIMFGRKCCFVGVWYGLVVSVVIVMLIVGLGEVNEVIKDMLLLVKKV